MQSSKVDPFCAYSQVSSSYHSRANTCLSFRKIAAFQLIEAGKLHLDTPVASIVPELANPVVLNLEHSGMETGQPGFRPAGQEMRIRHLLNHSSGMGYRPEGDILVPYATSYRQENPVGQFYDLLKVRLGFMGP